MAKVQKSVLAGYSASQMFELVDSVERYPEFLPWCGGTELLQRDESLTVATIRIDYMQVKQSFTTENTKRAPHSMTLSLKEGPFRSLEGSWHFIELNQTACKIEFHLSYEFSSKLIESVVGPVFSKIADNFVDAFIRRAEKIYG